MDHTIIKRPNFFIVGAPKCGTTAMHSYLQQHPDIFMPTDKEPSYFHVPHPSPQFQRYRSNLEKYLSLFSNATDETMIGEASPGYIYSEIAAKEIFDFDPNAKIIMMLREPVSMLSSTYHHRAFIGDEAAATFEDAIRLELDSLSSVSDPTTLSYLPRVQYCAHVKRFIDVFGRSQVHIIFFEEMKTDISGTYRRLLEFLNVDSTFQPEFVMVNTSKAVRSTPVHSMLRSMNLTPQSLRDSKLFHLITNWMSAAMYRKFIDIGVSFYSRQNSKADVPIELARDIRQYLRPDIEQLSLLLNRDLSLWSTGDVGPSQNTSS